LEAGCPPGHHPVLNGLATSLRMLTVILIVFGLGDLVCGNAFVAMSPDFSQLEHVRVNVDCNSAGRDGNWLAPPSGRIKTRPGAIAPRHEASKVPGSVRIFPD
jgi:hypothetical protein